MPDLLDPIYRSVDELFEVEQEATAFDDASRSRAWKRYYRVVVRQVVAGPLTACVAPGLPARYSVYDFGDGQEGDLVAILVRRTARRENRDDWQSWIVCDEYSTSAKQIPRDIGELGQSGDETDPTEWWPELSYRKETIHCAPPVDLDGNPYINSATQPFHPAYTTEYYRAVISVVRNEWDYPSALSEPFLNSEPFMGNDPETVLLEPVVCDRQFYGGRTYYHCHYTIKIRERLVDDDGGSIEGFLQFDPALNGGDGGFNVHPPRYYTSFTPPKPLPINTWQPCILDSGLNELQIDPLRPGHLRPMPIVRPGGGFVHQPVCLDGNGKEKQKVDRNGQVSETGRIRPVYCVFRKYQTIDLNLYFDQDFFLPPP